MKNRIWLSSPHMGGLEKKYVNEAFDENWVAPVGPNIDAFQDEISSYLDKVQKTHVAVVTSGTAAMHLALRILNVSLGDIVLVQSFTFCGTTNPVNYQGAEVVFIDSEEDTWNMCPRSLREAIERCDNKFIKAIVLVHLYGMPANLEDIQNIADEYEIPVIEDAAEALGSRYRDQNCGTFGEMSILSFNGNKIITTSGGGALLSKNKLYVDEAIFLSAQARDQAPHYQHSKIGFNYRMSNIVAGIGRGQMKVLNERVSQRRSNNKKYRIFFKNRVGITFQNEPSEEYFSNYWLTAILIDPVLTGGITREDVRLALEKENIESRPVWKPMHMQPLHQSTRFFGKGVCEKLFYQGLCLPSGSNLSAEDFDRIFITLEKVFKK